MPSASPVPNRGGAAAAAGPAAAGRGPVGSACWGSRSSATGRRYRQDGPPGKPRKP
jgi:hypothetical protein